MALVNSSVEDITADTMLATSKPKIDGNDDKLLANDVAIEARVTTLEGGSFSSATKTKFTAEGGLAIKLTNKTGTTSVKGTVVSAATGTDNAFILQANEYDAIGVVYENGIADAAECWVVVAGIAQVLLKDSTAATRGYIALCADTDGRFIATAPSGSPPIATDTHFKEIGHVIESQNSGTNVLCKCVLHFN
jgi:hypothetical protein